MKFRKIHGLAALGFFALCTSLGFQNCSRVAFTQNPETVESITEGSQSPAVCDDGQESGSIKWVLVPNQNIEEPGQCQYGGNLTMLYEKYQKSVCEAGQYVGQSEIKKGNLIGQRGACNCSGGVVHGTNIWQVVSGQTITDQQTCPASGTMSLVYEKEQQYTCNSGELVATGVFQKGKFLRQDGACMCADGVTEGSSSYQIVPNATITEAGNCPYGGNLQNNYEKLQKYTCTFSQFVAQDEYLKGKLLSTTGACNCEGGILDGAFKLVLLAGQTISEPVTCKYGGDLINLYEKQEKLLCSKGNFSSTGEFQKGAFLRQTGSCNPPPVLSETFSVSVSNTERPLDMIWVIDNSGSMDAEAANVRANLSSFISGLDTASDLKFLLVSAKGTSGTNVSLPAGLDPTRFMQANIAITSTGGPQTLLDVLTSSKNAGNPFFRDESKKIIVFVTDDNSALAANTFLTNVAALGAPSADVSIFGFIGLGAKISKCQAATGTIYQTLASQTAGNVFNICEIDWTQHFANLKTDVLTKLGRSFTLASSSVAITKVEVDGVVLDPSQYTLLDDVLTLSEDVVVTATSSVKVYYTQE